jgi:hypothetical protein
MRSGRTARLTGTISWERTIFEWNSAPVKARILVMKIAKKIALSGFFHTLVFQKHFPVMLAHSSDWEMGDLTLFTTNLSPLILVEAHSSVYYFAWACFKFSGFAEVD